MVEDTSSTGYCLLPMYMTITSIRTKVATSIGIQNWSRTWVEIKATEEEVAQDIWPHWD